MDKTSNHALTAGLQALNHVLSRDALPAAFTNLGGIGGKDIGKQASDPEFPGGPAGLGL